MPFPRGQAIRALDLCCGPGDVGRAIRQIYPKAQSDCIDRDPFLTSICRAVNQRDRIPGRLVLRDLRDDGWLDELPGNHDVVATVNALYWFDARAHAEIQIGDSVVMVEDESPERGTKAPPTAGADGSPSFLFIYVEDVDDVVARAVQLGATLKRSPENQFYGDRDGYIVDPFGHGWTIATHVEDVDPEEMGRRMAELQKQA
jgi:uncharacterized glyoxalase superfamily protein PhnB